MIIAEYEFQNAPQRMFLKNFSLHLSIRHKFEFCVNLCNFLNSLHLNKKAILSPFFYENIFYDEFSKNFKYIAFDLETTKQLYSKNTYLHEILFDESQNNNNTEVLSEKRQNYDQTNILKTSFVNFAGALLLGKFEEFMSAKSIIEQKENSLILDDLLKEFVDQENIQNLQNELINNINNKTDIPNFENLSTLFQKILQNNNEFINNLNGNLSQPRNKSFSKKNDDLNDPSMVNITEKNRIKNSFNQFDQPLEDNIKSKSSEFKNSKIDLQDEKPLAEFHYTENFNELLNKFKIQGLSFNENELAHFCYEIASKSNQKITEEYIIQKIKFK